MRKVMIAQKMRRSSHSIDMFACEISAKELVIGEPMRGYRALTSGIPGPWSSDSDNDRPSRTDRLQRKKSKPRPLKR